MLEFVIFAVTFFVSLLALVVYLYPGSRRQTTVPGLDPSDTREGNIGDILKANSLHQFLIETHLKFGEIISFWLYGPTLAVSVSSPKLIQSIDYLSEKWSQLFDVYKPFIGENSILFAKKNDARKQRAIWEQMFSQKSCETQSVVTKRLISELMKKWSTIPDNQHIPIGQYMKAFTLRLGLTIGFGDYFVKNNNEFIEFSKNFESCWTELESRILGDLTQDDNSPRNKRFQESVDNIKQLLIKVIQSLDRTKCDTILSPILFDETINDQTLIDECMTYLFKYYSLSSALMWTIYFLASDAALQNQIYDSLTISKTKHLIDGVVKSSIAAANVIQWTSRVNMDVDTQIGDHVIPKETPIICSLSSFHYKEETANPLQVFNDFLNSENSEFLAFGSKGSKRCCPAEHYCLSIIKEFLINVIVSFKLNLVDSDLMIGQIYKVYSKSEEEIWITIKNREKIVDK